MTTNYSKPAVRDAWADTAVPTTDIVDPGNTYVAAGWLQSATPPPRQYFNWALNWSASAIRYFMQNGIVDWDGNELYQTGSIVVYNNFVYQCLQNDTQGGAAPPSSPNWGSLAGYATLAQVAATYAPISNPTFKNSAYAPTPAAGDNSTQIATTEFLVAALLSYATKNNAQLTGTPTAPTAAVGTNSNQLATTAFTQSAITNAGTSALGNPGYQKFPSGLILQWGLNTFNSAGTTVDFPIPFPNVCNSVTTSFYGGTATVGVITFNRIYFTALNGINSYNSWFATGF